MQRKCLHEWGWFCAASVGGSVCILGRISTPVVTYNVSIMVVQLVDKNCSRLLGFKKPCRQRGLAGCTRKEDHHWSLFCFSGGADPGAPCLQLPVRPRSIYTCQNQFQKVWFFTLSTCSESNDLFTPSFAILWLPAVGRGKGGVDPASWPSLSFREGK